MARHDAAWTDVVWMKRAAQRHGITLRTPDNASETLMLAMLLAKQEPALSQVTWPDADGDILIIAEPTVSYPWMVHDLAHGLVARHLGELDMENQEVEACAVTMALLMRHSTPVETLSMNFDGLHAYFTEHGNSTVSRERSERDGIKLLRALGYRTRGTR